MSKPYTETQEGEFFIREFKPDVESDELKWHRDYEDRKIWVLNENDWKYQEDNKLPQPLQGELFIPKGLWHRVIKGRTNLKIKLQKIIS